MLVSALRSLPSRAPLTPSLSFHPSLPKSPPNLVGSSCALRLAFLDCPTARKKVYSIATIAALNTTPRTRSAERLCPIWTTRNAARPHPHSASASRNAAATSSAATRPRDHQVEPLRPSRSSQKQAWRKGVGTAASRSQRQRGIRTCMFMDTRNMTLYYYTVRRCHPDDPPRWSSKQPQLSSDY